MYLPLLMVNQVTLICVTGVYLPLLMVYLLEIGLLRLLQSPLINHFHHTTRADVFLLKTQSQMSGNKYCDVKQIWSFYLRQITVFFQTFFPNRLKHKKFSKASNQSLGFLFDNFIDKNWEMFRYAKQVKIQISANLIFKFTYLCELIQKLFKKNWNHVYIKTSVWHPALCFVKSFYVKKKYCK